MNKAKPTNSEQDTHSNSSAFSLFLIFLRLGLTSFGGPVAHIGYFHNEFVSRRKWFTEQTYSEIVALCQFLPGPASSQVGLSIGLSRAGYWGAFAAWLGFTMPSAIIMTLVALGYTQLSESNITGIIQGLKIVAVAVVAQALWGMFKSLCPDIKRTLIMIVATLIVSFLTSASGQLIAIVICGILGICFIKDNKTEANAQAVMINISKKTGIVFLSLFFFLLISLPILNSALTSQSIENVSSFYQTGSLVFGGGHVVLPLLQAEVVSTGQVTNDAFLAGYGAAQAVPGPLFTFASFIGASLYEGNLAWYGSILCLFAIFLPAFLLIAGALPFWQGIRSNTYAKTALAGANAGVVGLLLAVLYDPVLISTVYDIKSAALCISALIALMFFKLPPWLVVLSYSLIGFFLL